MNAYLIKQIQFRRKKKSPFSPIFKCPWPTVKYPTCIINHMCKSRYMLLVNSIFVLCISPIKIYLSKKVITIFLSLGYIQS